MTIRPKGAAIVPLDENCSATGRTPRADISPSIADEERPAAIKIPAARSLMEKTRSGLVTDTSLRRFMRAHIDTVNGQLLFQSAVHLMENFRVQLASCEFRLVRDHQGEKSRSPDSGHFFLRAGHQNKLFQRQRGGRPAPPKNGLNQHPVPVKEHRSFHDIR